MNPTNRNTPTQTTLKSLPDEVLLSILFVTGLDLERFCVNKLWNTLLKRVLRDSSFLWCRVAGSEKGFDFLSAWGGKLETSGALHLLQQGPLSRFNEICRRIQRDLPADSGDDQVAAVLKVARLQPEALHVAERLQVPVAVAAALVLEDRSRAVGSWRTFLQRLNGASFDVLLGVWFAHRDAPFLQCIEPGDLASRVTNVDQLLHVPTSCWSPRLCEIAADFKGLLTTIVANISQKGDVLPFRNWEVFVEGLQVLEVVFEVRNESNTWQFYSEALAFPKLVIDDFETLMRCVELFPFSKVDVPECFERVAVLAKTLEDRLLLSVTERGQARRVSQIVRRANFPKLEAEDFGTLWELAGLFPQLDQEFELRLIYSVETDDQANQANRRLKRTCAFPNLETNVEPNDFETLLSVATRFPRWEFEKPLLRSATTVGQALRVPPGVRRANFPNLAANDFESLRKVAARFSRLEEEFEARLLSSVSTAAQAMQVPASVRHLEFPNLVGDLDFETLLAIAKGCPVGARRGEKFRALLTRKASERAQSWRLHELFSDNLM